MEIAPSPAAPSAAAAGSRKLPPVRYYVPYEVEEEPVFDPDSPRSPSEQRADLPPLQIRQPREVVLEEVEEEEEEEEEPCSQDSGGGRDQEMHLEYYNYKTASTSIRQSDKYAEAALMHYNGDPGNEVKYKLVEAPVSNGGLMIGSGLMLGHVNFTARPVVVAGHEAAPPRPFFAEVRYESPYLMASCVMSLDDGEEELEEEDLCPYCGDYMRHPKLDSELRVENGRAAMVVRRPQLRC